MLIKKNKKSVEGIAENIRSESVAESVEESKNSATKSDEINLFDLDNIDFKQRNERRKGDRRRGFRRIDDRNLISRAKEEANSIRESAYKEGYQLGLDDAAQDIADVKDAIVDFLGAKQEIYENIAPDILEISIDIAKKIIKKEVTESNDVILANIKEILNGLSKEEAKIMLKVNPTQVAMLKEKVPEIVEAAGLEAKVVVMADENTMEGGCVVTTTNGVIDATIETQMKIVCEALKEV